MDALDVFNQDNDKIQQQADITAKLVYEYHAENPTPSTSASIRKIYFQFTNINYIKIP